MYLMCSSRPDIAYSVGRLSRYTHNPRHDNWSALVRLLKYLKGTTDFGLSYYGYPPVLEGYCDANWISESKDIHSTSGYVFTLAGAAVSWRSSKQTCIARSTIESEFIALELAGREVEWLRSLVADIPLWQKPVPSVPLHCDSQSAIHVAKNKAYNGKSRHIRLRHNIVCNLIKFGVISLDYVRSESNIADPLTKALNRKLVSETAKKMGLSPPT
ncbi:secreted RxLR effector protein 161-like [Silene latifolia]|uniref:secreted RxLR effector protein 161-like n=1 Tax=Silene latifolia TaxID=37657 RepID=UPI003D77F54E